MAGVSSRSREVSHSLEMYKARGAGGGRIANHNPASPASTVTPASTPGEMIAGVESQNPGLLRFPCASIAEVSHPLRRSAPQVLRNETAQSGVRRFGKRVKPDVVPKYPRYDIGTCVSRKHPTSRQGFIQDVAEGAYVAPFIQLKLADVFGTQVGNSSVYRASLGHDRLCRSSPGRSRAVSPCGPARSSRWQVSGRCGLWTSRVRRRVPRQFAGIPPEPHRH
jgi:hypothetical protein